MTEENAKYEHQMGGHGHIKQSAPGRLLKPADAKEIAFYQAVFSATFPSHLHFLRDFLPTFFGVDTLPSSDGAAQQAIIIEDVNFGLSNPSVLDIKVGTRHYDDDASEEKKARLSKTAKDTTTAQTGLRIVGMQAVKHGEDQRQGEPRVEYRGRDHGRAITVENLPHELLWFFHDGKQLRRDVVDKVRTRLQILAEGIKECTTYNFYSSSLLIAYDGAGRSDDEGADVRVRMIDFAHTVPTDRERDDGYLFGLETFLDILQSAVRT